MNEISLNICNIIIIIASRNVFAKPLNINVIIKCNDVRHNELNCLNLIYTGNTGRGEISFHGTFLSLFFCLRDTCPFDVGEEKKSES